MSGKARRAGKGTEFGVISGGFRSTAERYPFLVCSPPLYVQTGLEEDGGPGFVIHAGAVAPDRVNVGWGPLTPPNPIGIVPPLIGAGQPNGKRIQIEAFMELKGRQVRLIESRERKDPLPVSG